MNAGTAPTVCVLGSANVDLVAMTPRIPRLGETITGTRSLQVPGGKGANQALAAARAGAAVRFLGNVGDDAFGAQIRGLLAGAGIDVTGLGTVDVPTGTAHILVDGTGDNLIVVVPGANHQVDHLTAAHRSAIAASDVLLLQLEIPVDLVHEAASHAHRQGTAVVLTPAPVTELPDGLLAHVDVLVPNQHEATQLTGLDDPVDAARALLGAGVGAVVVTLGADGCVHVDHDGVTEVAAPAVTAVDATAAGDTFVGYLATVLARCGRTADGLRWAAAAAAISVQRPGASSSMPTRDEVARFLTEVDR